MIRLAREPNLYLTIEGLVALILHELGDAISHKSCEWRFRSLRGYTPPRRESHPL